MAGLSQSANSYPLEIDDTNLNTLYFSTNGITWYTNNITTGAGPPPTGSYSTIYTASILSLAMESPAFSQGALVCATNPCIRLLQTNDINSLSLKNLIISSLDNSPTNLMEVSVGYPRLSIESCWFGNWKQITNHATVFGQAGLTTTATDAGGGPHNLQIFIQGAVSDKCFMKDNIFLGISDIWVNQDHLDFIGNQFSFCGNRSGGVVANGWPTNSPQYNGAVLLLKHQVDDNWNFRDNLFYQCTAAYYKEDSANQTKSYNDYFEGGIYSVLYSNTIAPINFVEINPAAAQGLGVPGTATVTNNTVFGTTNLPEQVLLNAQVALFPGSISVAGTNFGNGAGLTNLNAANLTGTVPQGVLPGTVVTNNATGLTLSGTFSGNGSGLTNLSAGSLVGAATSFTLTNMASAGASAANTGHFWPSNTALYWVTPTKTNYITGP